MTTPITPAESPRMTVAEIAEATKLSVPIVRDMLERGIIPAVNVSRGQRRNWFVSRQAFAAWMESGGRREVTQ